MSATPTESASRSAILLSSIAAGALVGAVVNLVRAVLLLQMERSIGAGGTFLEWRIAEEFRAELPIGVVLGIAAGGWVWLWTRRFPASWILGWAGAAALLWLILVGGPWAPAFHRLDLFGTQGLAERILGIEAIVGGGLLLTWLIHAVSKRLVRGRIGGTVGVIVSFGLLLALPWSFHAVLTDPSLPMTTVEVRRDVLLDRNSWEVVHHHPSSEPRIGTISPNGQYTEDDGDRPALIMSPPCEIRFPIQEAEGEVLLQAIAGVDQNEFYFQRIRDKPKRVLFEIERNGELVFDVVIELNRRSPTPNLRWIPPPLPGALRCSPGDEITLRTSIVEVPREETERQRPMLLGFGGLTLERTVERERRRASREAPSIVLVVQDTMRTDRSSTYEYDKETTPALSELASRGITYTRALSTSSWTWPSTASILTGMLPHAHGVTSDESCYLISSRETLAEALQRRGYTTAAFSCNPLVSRQKSFDQGFEYFQQTDRDFIKTPELMDQVESWIQRHAGLRFFLYLHLVDPHTPYRPFEEDFAQHAAPVPDRFPGQQILREYIDSLRRGEGVDGHGDPIPEFIPGEHIEYLSSLYDASIATGDRCLGQLVALLRNMGLEDSTLVVFTSDHGESWMEHGLLAHGQDVHRELMEVPLVMAGPGLHEGVQCDTPVSNRHLAATLARVGGAELSLVEDAIDLSSPSGVPERPVYYGTMHGIWNLRSDRQRIYGVREGQWVLHFAPEGSDFGVPVEEAPVGGQCRLYDIVADPDETTDVSAEHPEIAERLKQMIMSSLADQIAQLGTTVQIGAGPATLKMLEAIGYTAGKIEEGE